MADDVISYEEALGLKPSSKDDVLSYEEATKAAPKSEQGLLTRGADEGYLSGLGKGAATAAIKGVSQIPGQAGNIRELGHLIGDYLYGPILGWTHGRTASEGMERWREMRQRGEKAFPSAAAQFPTGEEIAKPILGFTGAYEPESYAGKLGMAGLETGISMLGPGSGVVKLGEKALERGTPRLGFEALKETAKMAPAGFVPGVAGQAAYDITGNPLMAFGASLLAGGAQPFAKAGIEKAIRPVAEDIPYFGKYYEGERRRMAGEQLEKLSSDPEKLRETMFPPQGPVPQEIVPGSRPTTGQLTGDIGLLEAERAIKTERTEPFNVLEAEQNAARRRALQAIPSDIADTMTVPDLVSKQSAILMRGLDDAENTLQTKAIDLADRLGGKVPPEELGDQLRKSIEDVKKQVSDKVSELYKAVDPQGSISLVATPIRESVGNMVASIDPLGTPLNANETRIYGNIANMPDVLPFKSLIELDSSITEAMKQAAIAGEGKARGRLIQAKTAVQNAINKAIENQEKYENNLASRGEIKPEDTMAARVRKWTEDFYREKAGEAPPKAPEGLKPQFDEEAAGRLREAKEAHKEYAITYKEGPVPGAIKTTGFSGQYQIPAGAVPGRAVVPGARGYETAQSFLQASNNAPDAIFAMKESLLNDLRGRVKNNVLGINEINAWKTKFDGALRAMEEVDPGFSSRFDNAAIAADELANFGTQRKATEEAFQKSAAAKFLGAADPVEVEDRLGRIIKNEKTGVSQMRDLVTKIKSDPAALEGLRKAAADWIVRKMSTAAEAGTTQEKLLAGASFQKLVRDSEPILSQLFTPEQMNTIRAVAKDLERADRSVQATRIKGSPGTAKDLLKPLAKKGAEKLGDVGLLFGMFEIVKDAAERGGIKGAATVGVPLAAAYGFKHFRGTGIEKVQNIVRDAILDPRLAGQLLTEVPRDKLPVRAEIVGKMIQRGLHQPSETRPQREEYKRGGKVGYPAKKLSPIERAAARAYKEIAESTKPLMDMPDEHIAHALNMAKGG